MGKRSDLVERVEFLLVTRGYARIEAGVHRSDQVARRILREAAKNIGVEVTTTETDGFVRADVT